MKTKAIACSLLVSLVLALAGPAFAAIPGAPETTEDGLALVKKSKADILYRRPGATFGGYTKMLLVEPQIAFEKDWANTYNRDARTQVTAADLQTIIAKGRVLLLQEFTKMLEKNGYSLVTAAGDDVLEVRVSLLDLAITVPDPNNNIGQFNKTYTQSAGSATLVVELYDSGTGQVLARAYEREAGSAVAKGVARDHSTNVDDATYAFSMWAKMLVRGLERAKEAETAGK